MPVPPPTAGALVRRTLRRQRRSMAGADRDGCPTRGDQTVTADEILVMEAGRVVERGSHDELVGAGGRYAELWAAWSAG